MNELTNGIAVDASRTASPPFTGSQSRRWGVLVIDDDAGVRNFLRISLGATGFRVWLAADGHEGVSIYSEHGSTIDLLLLDLRMPDWDGPETLATIRVLAPDVPCCFMSGDIGHYTEKELLDLGAAAVFHKPLRLGEVIAQLRRMATPIDQLDGSMVDRWHDDGGSG